MSGKKNKRENDDLTMEEMNKRLRLGEDDDDSTKEEKANRNLELLDLPANIIGWIVSLCPTWERCNIRSTCKNLCKIFSHYKKYNYYSNYYYNYSQRMVDDCKNGTDIAVANYLWNPFADLTQIDYRTLEFLFSRGGITSDAASYAMISKDTVFSEDRETRRRFFENMCNINTPRSISVAKNMILNGLVNNPMHGFMNTIKNGNFELYELARTLNPPSELNFWTKMAMSALTNNFSFTLEDILKKIPGVANNLYQHISDKILNDQTYRLIAKYLPDDEDVLDKWMGLSLYRNSIVFLDELIGKVKINPVVPNEILGVEKDRNILQKYFEKAVKYGKSNFMDFLYEKSKNLFEWDNRRSGKKGSYIDVNEAQENLQNSISADKTVLKSMLQYQEFNVDAIYPEVIKVSLERCDVALLKTLIEHPRLTDKKEGELLMRACKELKPGFAMIVLDLHWVSKRADMVKAFFELCKKGGMYLMKIFKDYIDKDPDFWISYNVNSRSRLLETWFHICLAKSASAEALFVHDGLDPNIIFNMNVDFICNSEPSLVMGLIKDETDVMVDNGIFFTKILHRTFDKVILLSFFLRHQKAVFEDTRPHEFIRQIFNADIVFLFDLILETDIYKKLRRMIPVKTIFDLCISHSAEKILSRLLTNNETRNTLRMAGEVEIDQLENYYTEELLMNRCHESRISNILIAYFGINKPWISNVFNNAIEKEDLVTAYNILKHTDDVMKFGPRLYLLLKKIAVNKTFAFEVCFPNLLDILDRSIGVIHLLRLAGIFGNTWILRSIERKYKKDWKDTGKQQWFREELAPIICLSMTRGHLDAFMHLSGLPECDLDMYCNYLIRHCTKEYFVKILQDDPKVRDCFTRTYSELFLKVVDTELENRCKNMLAMYECE